VPILFRDRQAGKSKMSWRIAAEAMWLVPQLRRRRQTAGGVSPGASPPPSS
jgi:dolichol-phosphate mannosyltransferase